MAKALGPPEHRLAGEEQRARERWQRELLVRAAGWYAVGDGSVGVPGERRGLTLAEAYALVPVEDFERTEGGRPNE